MPVLASCVSSAVESPPRKKFKFSLKLKKKKAKGKNPMDSDSENDSGKEDSGNTHNCEAKGDLNSSSTKTTMSLTDEYTSFGLLTETVTPPLPYTGLANLGNTCYLNAVLQVLRYCPGFLRSLVNLDDISSQKDCTIAAYLTEESVHPSDEDLSLSTKPNIIHSLSKLINAMNNAEENYDKYGMEASEVKSRSGWTTLAVRPQDFVNDFSGLCPLFGGYQQHDAQEFLRSFLSQVEEECIGLVKGEQLENVRGGVSISSNESKVRGGCKYPSTTTRAVATKTVELPTKMMATEESDRIQPNKNIGCNGTDGLSCLQTATLKPSQKNGESDTYNDINVVKCLFEGTLLLQTCCLNCEGVRQRYENFQDISVPVQNSKSENRAESDAKLSDSEDEYDQSQNLSWAISKFASIERLNGDNKYFCDNCATLTEANISTYFEKLPEVLTIHLKRFQTSYGNQSLYTSSWVTKVTKSLHTPQRLSLKKWCSKTCTDKNASYTLFGVVMHNGMSSCSGHYLSYVNIDVLKKQNDRKRKRENSQDDSTAAQYDVGRGSKAMPARNSCVDAADQLCRTEVPSKLKSFVKDDAVTSKDVTKCGSETRRKDISTFDKEERCQVEDSCDLSCRECFDMDFDENTCDHPERLKDDKQDDVSTREDDMKDATNTNITESETQPRPTTGLRTCCRDNIMDDSDSSADEPDIPNNMDITKYFKPIPKFGVSAVNNCKNVEISVDRGCRDETTLNTYHSQQDGNDTCSKMEPTGQNISEPGKSLQKKSEVSTTSRYSRMNTKLGGESLICGGAIETTDTSKCLQDSESNVEKHSGQYSTIKSYFISTSKKQTGDSVGRELASNERLSCMERIDHDDRPTDQCSGSNLKLMLDVEQSDEQQFSQNKSNTCNSTDNANSVADILAQKTNHAEISTANGFKSFSVEKSMTCDGIRTSSCTDGSNTSSVNSTWLKFDDAEVHEISAKDMEEILSPSSSCYSTPYLLFYYRC